MYIDEIKNLLYDSGFIFDRIFGTNKNFTINFRNEK